MYVFIYVCSVMENYKPQSIIFDKYVEKTITRYQIIKFQRYERARVSKILQLGRHCPPMPPGFVAARVTPVMLSLPNGASVAFHHSNDLRSRRGSGKERLHSFEQQSLAFEEFVLDGKPFGKPFGFLTPFAPLSSMFTAP